MNCQVKYSKLLSQRCPYFKKKCPDNFKKAQVDTKQHQENDA